MIHDALNGGAADIVGNVTIAAVYAYADQALNAWEQRPLFKSHVSTLRPVRQCAPQVELGILRKLPDYFSHPAGELALDPSYEPDAEPKHPDNERVFGALQKLRAARLPVGAEHMYYAAMNSKSCRLTELGRFYWLLAEKGKI